MRYPASTLLFVGLVGMATAAQAQDCSRPKSNTERAPKRALG